MFKLKYSDMKSREFIMALGKCMQNTNYKSTTIAYNVAKIGRKFDQETKICQELYLKVIKAHAKLDEKGNIAPRVEGGKPVPNTYEISDDKVEAWKKACEDFDNTLIEIPCNKINLSDLENAGMSPADLVALEPVLETAPVKPISSAPKPA